jgi:molecular chaperone GrpE
MADDDATGSKTNDHDASAAPASGADGPGAAQARADATPADGEATTSEVEQLRVELESVRDKLLRERAELENFKRRAAREKAEALRYGSEGLLRDLLPVIDNLERALAHARQSGGATPIVEGVELVLRSLVETLERHGVTRVQARGERFDPAIHEAIGHVESEHPANTVVDEHQRGYALHDRLLRPALVTVGKGQVADAPARVETPENDG